VLDIVRVGDARTVGASRASKYVCEVFAPRVKEVNASGFHTGHEAIPFMGERASQRGAGKMSEGNASARSSMPEPRHRRQTTVFRDAQVLDMAGELLKEIGICLMGAAEEY
jgi:hypothetical protein